MIWKLREHVLSVFGRKIALRVMEKERHTERKKEKEEREKEVCLIYMYI